MAEFENKWRSPYGDQKDRLAYRTLTFRQDMNYS